MCPLWHAQPQGQIPPSIKELLSAVLCCSTQPVDPEHQFQVEVPVQRQL